MSGIDNFFSIQNSVQNISETDSQQLKDYLAFADAFARTTYMSIYIINYHTKSFDYVSDNPLFLCGLPADKVLKMGYDFYYSYVVKEDMELLYKINKVGFDFLDNIPVEDRKDYTISYDFRLKDTSDRIFLVNHKLTPLFLAEDGRIWKSLCIVSLSENQTPGNIKIYKKNDQRFWTFNLNEDGWETNNRIELTDREREILYLSIQGLTINEIAERIFVSSDTVKFHRKKLFDKIQVTNITEAISVATNTKLL